MFESIIKAALPGVSDLVRKTLTSELKHVADDFVAKNVVGQVAKVMLKGIDSVVEHSVKVLTSEQVAHLTGAYTDEIDRQFIQLNEAISKYIPLQVAVEIAKKAHGKDSAEANAARALRATGINEVKAEFGDLFGSIFGDHVQD